MNEYPFLPQCREELGRMLVERANEAMHTFTDGGSPPIHLPPWVSKMASNFAEQVFSTKASKALKERDGEFLNGFFVGTLFAIAHFAKTAPAECIFPGPFTAAAQFPSSPDVSNQISARIASAPFTATEIREPILALLSELSGKLPETRARFLEGVCEGSELEHIFLQGGFRVGVAFEIQFLMLFFWRDIEAMNSRAAVYRFLEFCFQGRSPDNDKITSVAHCLTVNLTLRRRCLS